MKNDSNQEMLYICGKCGGEIKKDDKVCPHCSVRLGKIKCPYCDFSGDEQDFKKDICPKCGHHKTLSVPYGSLLPNKKNSTTTKQHSKIQNENQSKIKVQSYKISCLVMTFIALFSIFAFLMYFKLI